MTMAVFIVGLLIGALVFGAVTVHGLKTGEVLALNNFAKRESDPDWFWGWIIINGVSAIGCVLGFVMMLA